MRFILSEDIWDLELVDSECDFSKENVCCEPYIELSGFCLTSEIDIIREDSNCGLYSGDNCFVIDDGCFTGNSVSVETECITVKTIDGKLINEDCYIPSNVEFEEKEECIEYIKFCGSLMNVKYSDGENSLLEDFTSGVTFNFILRPKDYDCNGINDIYPNNSGIFFMIGAKKSNINCGLESNCYTACTYTPILPDVEFIEEYIKKDINPFLYYSNACITEPEYITEGENCCENLCDNVLAFRITDQGAIGYRIIKCEYDCDISGETLTMIESYSADGVIEKDQWQDISISWKPNRIYESCEKRKGKLLFYVDGNLIYKVNDFEELDFYQVNEESLQESYNMSLGGGSYGNMCETPLQVSSYTVSDYSICLRKDVEIESICYNGNEIIFDEPQKITKELFIDNLDICEENIEIFNVCSSIPTWQLNIYNTILLDLKFKLKYTCKIKCVCNCGCFCNIVPLKVNRRYEVNIPEYCSAIEDYFGGTFIGDLAYFSIKNKYEDIVDIRNCIEEDNVYSLILPSISTIKTKSYIEESVVNCPRIVYSSCNKKVKVLDNCLRNIL